MLRRRNRRSRQVSEGIGKGHKKTTKECGEAPLVEYPTLLRLMTALITRLAFVTVQSVALISRLSFITQGAVAGAAGRDALFEFFDL